VVTTAISSEPVLLGMELGPSMGTKLILELDTSLSMSVALLEDISVGNIDGLSDRPLLDGNTEVVEVTLGFV
jgi:hypothetical protein